MNLRLGFFEFEYYQFRGPTHQMHCILSREINKHMKHWFEVFKTSNLATTATVTDKNMKTKQWHTKLYNNAIMTLNAKYTQTNQRY